MSDFALVLTKFLRRNLPFLDRPLTTVPPVHMDSFELTTRPRAILNDPDNTYSTHLDRVKGLPPTPIGNPGDAALKAAANPEPGDWTYFVVTEKDGHSSFTSDLRTHEVNVQKCKEIGVC